MAVAAAGGRAVDSEERLSKDMYGHALDVILSMQRLVDETQFLPLFRTVS